MNLYTINNEIVNECGSAVGVFINSELAETFMKAYNKAIISDNALKSKIQTELDEIRKCFNEFNEYIENGGIISKDSIVHFGIKSLIK